VDSSRRRIGMSSYPLLRNNAFSFLAIVDLSWLCQANIVLIACEWSQLNSLIACLSTFYTSDLFNFY
jgi:hypothetical protein